MLKYLKLLTLIAFTPAHAKIEHIDRAFEDINQNVLNYNVIAADIAWQASLNPDNPDIADRAATYQQSRLTWQHETCDELEQWRGRQLLNSIQRRQTYLLCRGPRFLVSEAGAISSLYDELQTIYSDAKICLPIETQNQQVRTETAILNFLASVKNDISDNETISTAVKLATSWNFQDLCLRGEDDFKNLMYGRNEKVLRWTWLVWREEVGPPMKQPYEELVDIENRASNRNGYSDIGESWRDELETANLREVVQKLYGEVRPLYVALHGIVRFFLRKFYGGNIVSERGAIPSHILGDLWSQDWGKIIELVLPQAKDYDLDENIKNTNWTTIDMVRKTEDFYTSMSLPPMTEQFWSYSVLERDNSSTRCHGTAANMFRDRDYRMLYCADLSMHDFYVIHHEMGHIQYYMAYEKQPAIFREGTNSAFQETIGDTIMYGVMSPQHLHRLGLINDNQLYSIPRKGTNDKYSKYDQKQEVKIFLKYIRDVENGVKDKLHYKDNDNREDKNTQFNSKHDNQYVTKDFIFKTKYDLGAFDKAKYNLGNNYDNIEGFIGPAYIKNNQREFGKLNHGYYRYIGETNERSTNSKKTNEIIFKINDELEQIKNNLNKTGDALDKTKYIHKNGDYLDITETKSNNHDKFKDNLDETIYPFDVTFDEIHLMKQALTAIPQIPFSLLIDEYRWSLFEGMFKKDSYNEHFWKLVYKYQGLAPPDGQKRGEKYFDAGAKFHVPDNTPYIRYFLSSFLQTQVYRALCRATVTSHNNVQLPQDLPLHRCDIYGSKRAGALLQKMMSQGASIHWREALNILTGENDISPEALLQYYQPLYPLLAKIIHKYHIPLVCHNLTAGCMLKISAETISNMRKVITSR